MVSSSPENDPKYFGFTDLHGFKDFIVEVIAGAPDDFMQMDWLAPEEQMNLERAFVGLRYGLDLTANETGDCEFLTKCRGLIDLAYADYLEGRDIEGQRKLEDIAKLLSGVPSR